MVCKHCVAVLAEDAMEGYVDLIDRLAGEDDELYAAGVCQAAYQLLLTIARNATPDEFARQVEDMLVAVGKTRAEEEELHDAADKMMKGSVH